jgi:nitroreductase
MNLDNLLKQRASIRTYSSKKPTEEQVISIIEAANLAPSPGNLPILTYTIVEGPEKINKIAQACQQEFIKSAQILIIICSNPKNVEIMYDKRASKYVKQQTGAAIENMLLKITELGLASCWVGAFSDITIKNALKIPDEIEVEAVLPIAYPLKTDKTEQKLKPVLETRVFFETYKNKEKVPIKKIGRNIE